MFAMSTQQPQLKRGFMKNFIFITILFFSLSQNVFAKSDYKITKVENKEELLIVTAEIDVDGHLQTVEVPIFGTYTKAYVHEAVKNRVNQIVDEQPGGLVFAAKSNRKKRASDGVSALTSEIGKKITVSN